MLAIVSAVYGSLARRGMEQLKGSGGDESTPTYDMPGWGIAMLAITAAIFVFVQFMVRLLDSITERIRH